MNHEEPGERVRIVGCHVTLTNFYDEIVNFSIQMRSVFRKMFLA